MLLKVDLTEHHNTLMIEEREGARGRFKECNKEMSERPILEKLSNAGETSKTDAEIVLFLLHT